MKKILFIFGLLLFSSIASATTTLEIQPSTLSVDPNDTFTITFYVVPGETIDTVATDLITWDAAILECIKVDRGDLFENPTIWIEGTIQNGKITNLCWASSVNTSSPGIFINITFKAKSSGTTTITINAEKYGVALEGTPVDRMILNNCEITVTGTPSQPPSNPPSNPPEEPPEIPDEPTANETNETQPQNNTNETQNESNYSPPVENPPEEPNHEETTNSENNENSIYILIAISGAIVIGLILLCAKNIKKQKEEIDIFEKDEEKEQITGDGVEPS